MTTEQRLDSIERLLGTVTASLQTVATLTEQNAAAVQKTNQSLEDSVSDLVATIGRFVDEGERDRAVFQAEINRMWTYLTGQQTNGAGS